MSLNSALWNWRVLGAGALVLWAVGLQVHMWHLQERPEFRRKFGGSKREEEPLGREETRETTFRVSFNSGKQSEE